MKRQSSGAFNAGTGFEPVQNTIWDHGIIFAFERMTLVRVPMSQELYDRVMGYAETDEEDFEEILTSLLNAVDHEW